MDKRFDPKTGEECPEVDPLIEGLPRLYRKSEGASTYGDYLDKLPYATQLADELAKCRRAANTARAIARKLRKHPEWRPNAALLARLSREIDTVVASCDGGASLSVYMPDRKPR